MNVPSASITVKETSKENPQSFGNIFHLEDGLVFQLTKANEFQAFIIWVYSSSGVDKGFGLRVSEALTKQIPPCRPTGIHEKIDHIRANTCAKKRTEEVQRNLDPKYPSIVRPLCSYHVGSGNIQLQHLTPSFCNLYLPNQDVTFTLVEEDTAYSLSGVDKDFGLRDSEAPAMQNTTCTPIRTNEKTELKCPSTIPFGTILRLENLVSESEHERYAKKRKEALDEFVRMLEEWKRLTQFQKVEGEDSFASIQVAEAGDNSYNIKGAKKAFSYPIYN
ncbi:hypothetical protein GIB67_009647 [Kingdonia uniflora]|uniref:Uncharacterized protein n=1 Tax=Kingdonia uniflora TaxID=39325 RepID=A0A7J7LB96_9MAGN|nr:hypothetical protein GIB67_009647 [Kingdonia uniflora]